MTTSDKNAEEGDSEVLSIRVTARNTEDTFSCVIPCDPDLPLSWLLSEFLRQFLIGGDEHSLHVFKHLAKKSSGEVLNLGESISTTIDSGEEIEAIFDNESLEDSLNLQRANPTEQEQSEEEPRQRAAKNEVDQQLSKERGKGELTQQNGGGNLPVLDESLGKEAMESEGTRSLLGSDDWKENVSDGNATQKKVFSSSPRCLSDTKSSGRQRRDRRGRSKCSISVDDFIAPKEIDLAIRAPSPSTSARGETRKHPSLSLPPPMPSSLPSPGLQRGRARSGSGFGKDAGDTPSSSSAAKKKNFFDRVVSDIFGKSPANEAIETAQSKPSPRPRAFSSGGNSSPFGLTRLSFSSADSSPLSTQSSSPALPPSVEEVTSIGQKSALAASIALIAESSQKEIQKGCCLSAREARVLLEIAKIAVRNGERGERRENREGKGIRRQKHEKTQIQEEEKENARRTNAEEITADIKKEEKSVLRPQPLLLEYAQDSPFSRIEMSKAENKVNSSKKALEAISREGTDLAHYGDHFVEKCHSFLSQLSVLLDTSVLSSSLSSSSSPSVDVEDSKERSSSVLGILHQMRESLVPQWDAMTKQIQQVCETVESYFCDPLSAFVGEDINTHLAEHRNRLNAAFTRYQKSTRTLSMSASETGIALSDIIREVSEAKFDFEFSRMQFILALNYLLRNEAVYLHRGLFELSQAVGTGSERSENPSYERNLSSRGRGGVTELKAFPEEIWADVDSQVRMLSLLIPHFRKAQKEDNGEAQSLPSVEDTLTTFCSTKTLSPGRLSRSLVPDKVYIAGYVNHLNPFTLAKSTTIDKLPTSPAARKTLRPARVWLQVKDNSELEFCSADGHVTQSLGPLCGAEIAKLSESNVQFFTSAAETLEDLSSILPLAFVFVIRFSPGTSNFSPTKKKESKRQQQGLTLFLQCDDEGSLRRWLDALRKLSSDSPATPPAPLPANEAPQSVSKAEVERDQPTAGKQEVEVQVEGDRTADAAENSDILEAPTQITAESQTKIYGVNVSEFIHKGDIPLSSPLSPFRILRSQPKQFRRLLTTSLPCSPKEFYALFYSSKSQFSQLSLQRRGCREIEVPPWSRGSASESLQRTLRFVIRVDSAFVKTSSRATVVEAFSLCANDQNPSPSPSSVFTLVSSSQTPDVPYGKDFIVETIISVKERRSLYTSSSSSTASATETLPVVSDLTISVAVFFLSSPLIRGMIESSCFSETKASMTNLVTQYRQRLAEAKEEQRERPAVKDADTTEKGRVNVDESINGELNLPIPKKSMSQAA